MSVGPVADSAVAAGPAISQSLTTGYLFSRLIRRLPLPRERNYKDNSTDNTNDGGDDDGGGGGGDNRGAGNNCCDDGDGDGGDADYSSPNTAPAARLRFAWRPPRRERRPPRQRPSAARPHSGSAGAAPHKTGGSRFRPRFARVMLPPRALMQGR